MTTVLPRLLAALWLLVAAATAIHAAEIQVATLSELQAAIQAAAPGDSIILADGKYESTGTIAVTAAGTAEKPIVISAKTVGGVELQGEAGFRLKPPAAYVVIRGFVFTHKAGEMALEPGVHHCRVTRNVFELAVTDHARYLAVDGDDNEIDHNTFRNKSTEGQMLHVQGPGTTEMAQRTWIHHNYFVDFRNARRNNASALHIGHSARSMTSAHSIVEHNLFVRTQGENEGAICNKSSDNIYRYNTFGEDSSELSIRHGLRCLIYGNYFLGGTGIRFFGLDHRIFSNYFENCRFAIDIGNGDATIPPGKLTSHQRPDRVQVVNNTLVDNRTSVAMSARGSNAYGANDLVFANNIIVGGPKAVTIGGPLENPTFAANLLWNNEGGVGDIPADGYVKVDPKLVADEYGIKKLTPTSPAVGRAVGDYPYVKFDIDGQPRGESSHTVGADEISSAPVNNCPLTPADVGPAAPDEAPRPLISAPLQEVEWLK